MERLMRGASISRRRWLLIPIEVKHRELLATAMLGFVAAERGWGTLLGRKGIREREDLPPGVFVEKDICPTAAASSVDTSRKRGRKVTAWSEEGLIYPSPEQFARMHVQRDAYDMLDRYFAWGPNQASDMVDVLGLDGSRIATTGNPRLDLHQADLRPLFSADVQAIQDRYGPYFLINTKFKWFNHYLGTEGILAYLRDIGAVVSAEEQDRFWARVRFEEQTMAAFEEMIVQLSRQYPDHTVIVRPHPSENHDTWKTFAARYRNVTVTAEGNVLQWILGAVVSVHNNCTTGVEAYLMDKPTVAFRPVQNVDIDLYLPNALSSEAGDVAQLMAYVESAANGRAVADTKDVTTKRDIARRFIANVEGTKASNLIMANLESIDAPEAELHAPAYSLADLGARAGRRWRQAISRPSAAGARTWQEYGKQKFDGTSHAELQSFLEAARQATGRFGDVQVSTLGESLFCIH